MKDSMQLDARAVQHVVLFIVLGLSILLNQQVNANTFSSFNYPGLNRTEALDINNNGEIVGVALNAPDTFVDGFLYDGVSFVTIAFPDQRTSAHGINDLGQVVGSYHPQGGGDSNGFVWEDGISTTINFPGSPNTSFNDINNNGQVVGTTRASNGAFTGSFLWEAGNFTQLNIPAPSHAWGINDFGHIVGFHGEGSALRGFVYDGSSFDLIDVPGSSYTTALGINNSGQIVGWFGIGETAQGFLFDGNDLFTFAFPGAAGTFPYGINDDGLIVGSYWDSPGGPIEHGFYATVDSSNFDPFDFEFDIDAGIPEPGTFVLGLIGAAALVMLRWRRSQKSTP